MTIHVVSHIPMTEPLRPGYDYMYVGQAGVQMAVNALQKTDRKHAENIANKNASYCELTALHQIALDAKTDPNGVHGLVHYRRRFLGKTGPFWYFLTRLPSHWIAPHHFSALFARHELDGSRAQDWLAHGADVILPPAWWLRSSVMDQYARYHNVADLQLIREAIDEVSPQYLAAYERVLASWRLRPFNMIIARGQLLQSYADWLFSVLNAFELKVDLSILNTYQQRIFGFVAERLLNVYFEHHQELRVCSVPVAFVARR